MNKQETKPKQQTLEPTRLGRFEAGNVLNCSENGGFARLHILMLNFNTALKSIHEDKNL